LDVLILCRHRSAPKEIEPAINKIRANQRRTSFVSWKSLRQFSPQTTTAGSLVLRLASFPARATEPTQNQTRPARSSSPQDYQTANFLLHTDLGPQEADDLLKRLEKMLSLISKYWGRRNSKRIECYVVKDLNNWPKGSLHSTGREKIAQQSGLCRQYQL
jgi:hypothetical protein